MNFSKLFCPTLREDPADAEVISHRLMVRSGMIRQVASGIYSLLPLGLKVTRKIEQIVREEMNRAGAQEVYLPAIHPAELWRESGRWDTIGKELLRMVDRNNRECCFGPTHEEVITDLVRREIRSYKELPKILYQIQVKFRDEVRPRFGLMRCREFIMKDAYSFGVNDQECEESYKKMFEAYQQIFSRCGLAYRAVEADSGSIGGSLSQEFMVLAQTGEDELLSCAKCGYAANVEKAQSQTSFQSMQSSVGVIKQSVSTPNICTIDEVCSFFKTTPDNLLKTLIYRTEEFYVAVVIPGDRDVNEIKLKTYLGVNHLGLSSEKEIKEVLGLPMGFVGPVDLPLSKSGIQKIVVDNLVIPEKVYVVGANKLNEHWIGVVAGKDFTIMEPMDIHLVKQGDSCVHCGHELRSDRGIEVGHVFKLGTKYSKALNAKYVDSQGNYHLMMMGCYGIGIGRIAAAAIEQNHDDRGIIFPPALAPFDVIIVPIDWNKDALQKQALTLYEFLLANHFDVLLDDRIESAGSKFKDADLLGIPVRVTIGDKGISQGNIEVKLRWKDKGEFVQQDQLLEWVSRSLKSEWEC